MGVTNKKLWIAGALGCLGVGAVVVDTAYFARTSVADIKAEIVALKADRIFVPKGFDDNDTSEVVLDGWLPSTCDKVIEPSVKVDPETRTISIVARAERGAHVCMPILTRFTVTAKLGVLPMGDYLLAANEGELKANLFIDEATSAGPDDYTYAQVDKVWVDFAPDYLANSDSRWAVVLEGVYTNSCQQMDEIRVKDSGDTIEVLPVVREDGEACLPVLESFVTRAPLPEFAAAGRHLLHVRSQNGNSLNKVFSVYGE